MHGGAGPRWWASTGRGLLRGVVRAWPERRIVGGAVCGAGPAGRDRVGGRGCRGRDRGRDRTLFGIGGARAGPGRAMASSERSALLTYRLCGGSAEEERGRERGRAAAAPRKLPTFLGVVVPTLLSMFSVVLFLRLGECRRPRGTPRSRPRPGAPRESPALPGTPSPVPV